MSMKLDIFLELVFLKLAENVYQTMISICKRMKMEQRNMNLNIELSSIIYKNANHSGLSEINVYFYFT